jgi:hypothetical protein
MRGGEPLARALGLCVGAGATLAVLSPLVEDPNGDSFPISSYPMFARPRGQPTLYAAVARDREGSESRLPPSVVGSSEVLQTKVLIERSVQNGPRAMQDLCNSIADKVAASPDAGRLRSIELVRRRYDPIAYFVSGPSPLEQERLTSCAVPGKKGPRSAGAVR